MLTVVQQEQEPSVTEVLSEGLDRPTGRRVVQTERPSDLLGEQGGVAQPPQVDHPAPVSEATSDLLGRAQGEPSLPHTRRTGQGQDPRGGQETPYLGDFLAPAHEPGRLRRQDPFEEVGPDHTDNPSDPRPRPDSTPTFRIRFRSSPDARREPDTLGCAKERATAEMERSRLS